MRRLVAAVCAACIAQLASAEPLPEPYHVQERPWGEPSRIVPPEYPADALAQRRTGSVDLIGWIDALGQYRDVAYEAGTPDSAAFVQSLRQVAGFWRFHPLLGNDCMPRNDRVVTRVWFEVVEGKPKVSVSSPTLPKRTTPRMDPVERVEPRYPDAMRRSRGDGAVVFTRQDIEPDGTVSNVAMQTFAVGQPAPARPFEREVDLALRDWRWPALPAGESRKRAACYQVVFKLVG